MLFQKMVPPFFGVELIESRFNQRFPKFGSCAGANSFCMLAAKRENKGKGVTTLAFICCLMYFGIWQALYHVL